MLGLNGASFQELDHDGQGGAIHCLGKKANGFFGMVTLRASGAKHQWRTQFSRDHLTNPGNIQSSVM